jgi:hypothetical protein
LHHFASLATRAASIAPCDQSPHSASLFSGSAVNQRRGANGELWQARFFDRALRSVKEYNEKVGYIHLNTARQGRTQTRRAESLN